MATPNLAISMIQSSQNTKEITANAALDAHDVALTDSLLTYGMNDFTTTMLLADALRHMVFILTNPLTNNRTLVVPNNKKLYVIKNTCALAPSSLGNTVTVSTAGGTGVAILSGGGYSVVYCDGVNVVDIEFFSYAFTSLTDAPGSYATDGDYAVQVNVAANALEFKLKPFDVAFFLAGTYVGSQNIVLLPLGRTVRFKSGLSTSQGVLQTAATATTVFSIQRNLAEFATLTFAAGATVGTFICTVDSTFVAGDKLLIVAPSSVDATAAGLGVTLVGVRV